VTLGTASIYLSTFLLERNRWNGKGPSLVVSDWIEPIAEAGFHGLEIWAPHLFFSSRSEWEAIREKASAAGLPIVFLSARLSLDASDKSARQRDSLQEAADYFAPQGIKLGLGNRAMEDQCSFLGEWGRDLPRGMQLVCAWEGGENALASCRQKIGSRFRCSLNPFLPGPEAFESACSQAGMDAVVDLGVKILADGKGLALRDAGESCLAAVSLSRRLGFHGSWSLECTAGAGEPGENIDILFDEAEEDLNFLAGILSRN
jgi:hypothetical protein